LSFRAVGLSIAILPAAQAQDAVTTAPVVVTATRVEQSSFDIPASIDAIDASRIRDNQSQVNLSETLSGVAGVVANNRQNYAQDLQISIRGFGARSTFGVRGIRLYADGIPLTMPDGAGQAANIDLGSAKRIEVLRGPFSALYGSSSGGVISVFTEDGPERPTLSGSSWFGTFGSYRAGAKAGGQVGPVNYVLDAAQFDTEGYRDHSSARRDTANAKLKLSTGENTTVSVIANYLNQPETQDPLGLTKTQAQATPSAAGDNAEFFNTRKSVENSQAGLVLDHKVSDSDVMRAMIYSGKRTVQQFLAIPAPGNTRGVVDLNRDFGGVDLRWTHNFSDKVTMTGGINYDKMLEARKAFTNSSGSIGPISRNEDNTVFNFDQYLQGQWNVSESFSLIGGVRRSAVRFDTKDHFISGTNGDDSGNLDYGKSTPVVGATFKLTPTINVYANAGIGFETPTFAELAYKSTSATVNGFNFGLKAAESKNYEVGMKAYVGEQTRVNVAAFRIGTENEIVVFTNSGGRSVFQNVDHTTRKGFELAIDTNFGNNFAGLLSMTYLDARYDNAFGTCAVGLCTSVAGPNATVTAGNLIPGIPKTFFYGEISWKQNDWGFSTALEARHVGQAYANDLNDESADAYTVVNLRAGFTQKTAGWVLTEFARVDNALDKEYIGSLIVNESNRRYYEPAPGRNYTVGLNASYSF
jgi:iron complex outermembrane receptor protein